MKINKQKLLLRLLTSPFVFCLMLIAKIYISFKILWQFILYGGEFIVLDKDDKATINKIYNKLKEKE